MQWPRFTAMFTSTRFVPCSLSALHEAFVLPTPRHERVETCLRSCVEGVSRPLQSMPTPSKIHGKRSLQDVIVEAAEFDIWLKLQEATHHLVGIECIVDCS